MQFVVRARLTALTLGGRLRLRLTRLRFTRTCPGSSAGEARRAAQPGEAGSGLRFEELLAGPARRRNSLPSRTRSSRLSDVPCAWKMHRNRQNLSSQTEWHCDVTHRLTSPGRGGGVSGGLTPVRSVSRASRARTKSMAARTSRSSPPSSRIICVAFRCAAKNSGVRNRDGRGNWRTCHHM